MGHPQLRMRADQPFAPSAAFGRHHAGVVRSAIRPRPWPGPDRTGPEETSGVHDDALLVSTVLCSVLTDSGQIEPDVMEGNMGARGYAIAPLWR